MMTHTKRAYLARWLLKAGAVAWVGLMVVGLMGCSRNGEPLDAPAKATASTDTLNAKTYVVAQHDTCVVFYTKTTMGPDVNWVRCFDTVGEATTYTQVTQSCGKNCTKRVTVATLAR